MENFSKKLLTLVLIAAIGLLVSLSVAIPLSILSKKDKDSKARQFLDRYPLIDGYEPTL
jgi:ABC-type phosphate/phosphonate transport system permease subunit